MPLLIKVIEKIKISILSICLISSSNGLKSQVLNPLLIDNLRIWLSSDSINDIDTVNGLLSYWQDLSTNGMDLTPFNLSASPTIIKEPYTGLNVVSFDGIDDGLFSSNIQFGSELTVFFIAKNKSFTNNPNPVQYCKIFNSDFFFHYIEGGSSQTLWHINNFIRGTLPPLNTPFFSSIEISSAGTDSYFINSSPVGVYNNSGPIIDSPSPFYLGNSTSGANPYQGEVYELIIYDKVLSSSERDTVISYLTDKYVPTLDLGEDRVLFCDSQLTVFHPFYKSYAWNTGATDSYIHVDTAGLYSVTVTDIFGVQQIDYIQLSNYNGGYLSKTIICHGESVVWNTELDHDTYDFIWNDLTTDSVLTIQDTGVYSVVISDTLGCSGIFLSPRIEIDSFPLQASLGPDTTLCSGNTISLVSHAPAEVLEYLWSTGSSNSELAIINSGTYGVYVKNTNQCEAYDTIQVTIQGMAPQVHYLSSNLMCEGVPISFIDSSYTLDGSLLTGWEWQISNIDTFYVQNPSYTFNSSGLYPVQLYVQSSNGCRGLLKDTFNIQASPQSQFSTNTNLFCSGQEVSFTNLSSTTSGVVTSVFWNFGSAPSDTSHLINPVFAYENPGNYPLFMIASNSFGCQDTIFQTMSVLNSPKAGLLMDSACTGTSVQFSDNSLGNITLWAWNFGNGNTSTQVNPTTLYSSTGQYTVQLTVVDQNSCVDDTLVQHRVLQSPLVQLSHSPICFDQTVSFSGNSTTYNGPWQSILWQAESESQFWTSTSDTFLFTPAMPNQPLVVSVQMVDSTGCVASKVDTFDVYSSPHANFSYSPLYGNPPLNVSLIDESEFEQSIQWTIESTFQTSPGWTYEFLDTGSYAIQLIAQNIEGCADTLIQKIQVGNLKYDVALTDLKVLLDSQNDRSEVQVNLKNQGNIPVFEAELLLDIHQNNFSWLETWKSTQGLWPGQAEVYVFNAQVQFSQLSRPQYLCSKAQIPNVETDLTNNILCTALNTDSLWAMLYPNPVIEDALYLRLINPFSEPLTVSVYSPLGDMVFSQSYAVFEQQWKEVLINTTHMHSGTYILEVRGASEYYRTLFQVLRSID